MQAIVHRCPSYRNASMLFNLCGCVRRVTQLKSRGNWNHFRSLHQASFNGTEAAFCTVLVFIPLFKCESSKHAYFRGGQLQRNERFSPFCTASHPPFVFIIVLELTVVQSAQTCFFFHMQSASKTFWRNGKVLSQPQILSPSMPLRYMGITKSALMSCSTSVRQVGYFREIIPVRFSLSSRNYHFVLDCSRHRL